MRHTVAESPTANTGAMDAWLQSRANVRERRGLTRRAGASGCEDAGTMLDLASNDYLGLSRDSRLTAAAVAAVEQFGSGARASRVVTGTLPAHEFLEEKLCTLTGAASALVFSSGYLANLGILGSLGGPGTLLILDAHVHASLLDAARLSRSPVVTVSHSDLEDVERALKSRSQPRAVVVVESLYSVLGDSANLTELAALCAMYDAWLLVDEAHGIGVAGSGRGAVHAAGLAGAPHVVVTATLSKALGAQGGAVLGSAALRDHLVNTARPFIFDTALAPASAAAAARAAQIIAAEPELATRLQDNAATLADLCGIGRSQGAVQSIPMATADDAVAAAARLRAAGVLVGCFRPPSVPDGVSRLRLTARADLTHGQMVHAARLIRAVLQEQPARNLEHGGMSRNGNNI
ncbi:8-amino-7-oxononanoate synthase [Arthrobacter alpinus]|uniref:8-amino-7-oxononanoate synthase n=1 Tax=Arthrobacter alpinus TaxID=656366 RepID=UPI0006784A46|nr:8-amino-7-oxononanoate synthase [Arthrobacter alpinus]ALV45647.1 8-amino-7-oxononanoate synthase [Arthrobacter alpinus]